MVATIASWQLSATVVDVIIALSVAYVGLQGIRGRPPNWRRVGAIVFAFGLVHGLGLSTRLQDLGLPDEGIVGRLVLFNVGVELGQLAALSVIVGVGDGAAPVGSTLKLTKSFQTSTSPVWQDDFRTVIGDSIQFPDTLTSELKVTAPTFSWHVNPSTPPVVAGRHGRDPTAPPQGAITLANPGGIAAENVNYPTQPFESIPFTSAARPTPSTTAGSPSTSSGRTRTPTGTSTWSTPPVMWSRSRRPSATPRRTPRCSSRRPAITRRTSSTTTTSRARRTSG